jgi:hypothetical protein
MNPELRDCNQLVYWPIKILIDDFSPTPQYAEIHAERRFSADALRVPNA